jgi:hypothetical protein
MKKTILILLAVITFKLNAQIEKKTFYDLQRTKIK